MGKLKFTSEELEAKYRERLDVLLDDCDWITYIDGKTVCHLVSKVLEEFDMEINEKVLYKKYDLKVKSLGLGDEKWRDTYGISEIIKLIYDLIE